MGGLIQDQVWIGSQDSIIYIIDTLSMSCNKQLTEHRHEVTGLTVDPGSEHYRYTHLFFVLVLSKTFTSVTQIPLGLPKGISVCIQSFEITLPVSRHTPAAVMGPFCSGTWPPSK